MARRQMTVTIDQPAVAATGPTVVDGKTIPGKPARPQGRDHGKVFILTEMAAAQAERWAIRALLALTNAGASVPDTQTGMAGLAVAGMEALGKLSYSAAAPLLDEMFTCVKYQHKPGQPPVDPDDENIEEVATRFTLRKAIFTLHTDFS